jgi:hypothetical protein
VIVGVMGLARSLGRQRAGLRLTRLANGPAVAMQRADDTEIGRMGGGAGARLKRCVSESDAAGYKAVFGGLGFLSSAV